MIYKLFFRDIKNSDSKIMSKKSLAYSSYSARSTMTRGLRRLG